MRLFKYKVAAYTFFVGIFLSESVWSQKDVSQAGGIDLLQMPNLSGSEQQMVYDLPQALAVALQENSELAFERSRLEQTRAQLGVAFGEWLPRLTLTHNNGGKQVQSNATIADRKNYHYQFHDFAVEFRQNLFSGFSTQARYRRAELQLKADELRLAQKTQAKALEVVTAHVELQRVRSNYGHVRYARNRTAELLQKIRLRGTVGMVAPVEVQRVESRFLAIENQLFDQYRALQAADTAFLELTRRRAATKLAPVSGYQGFTLKDLPGMSLVRLNELALLHPLRLQAETIQLVREEDRREARAAYFPQIDAVVRHATGHNTNGYTNVPGNDQNDTTAQLVLNWTLFDGLQRERRVDAAVYAQEGAIYALQDVVARLDKRIEDGWNDLNLVSSRLRTAQASATAAAATEANYEELVLSGRRTLVEGVNVIEELMRANLELSNQKHLAWLLSYRLAAEVGVLDVTSLLEVALSPVEEGPK